MGCRIKEHPDKIFDWFFEVASPSSPEDDPEVVRQFPEEFNDQDSIQKFPKFCFPFDMDRVKESTVVQNFTFVLTDLEGNQRFGFCRLSVGFKACICILSYLPWFEVFYKLLNNIADHLAKEQLSDLAELLGSLYRQPVPQSHSAVTLQFDHKFTKLSITTGNAQKRRHKDPPKDSRGGTESTSYFIAPDSGGLPTIPESRNLTEFVLAVDVNNMLQLYASMLHERRILITSSKLSTLTACVQASTAMLYPMYWQNIYIPILPPHLLDYCCAPMPYLVGVHASLMERVRAKALEDVVILHVDSNTLETPFQDLESLPADVISLLKLRLKKQSAVTGDGVARAFLRAQALLFGSYREALVCTPGEPITFCEESFLNHKSNPVKQFLQNAVHLQLFKEFIDGRLVKLNSGAGFCDVFEQEIDSCGLSAGPSKSYQLWVENVKKGGGALIHTVKNKTNPAMKHMFKYAKGQAKMGLKEMRIRLKHKSRPRRPSNINPLYEENSSWVSESDVSASTEDNPESADTSNVQSMEDHFLDTGEIDLLGEIFDTLSMRATSERGLLYGTQSLDFFNLEDSSFIKKLNSPGPTSDENLSSRRVSEPFGGNRYYLDEDFSLGPHIPSSESLSISEEAEDTCGQGEQEVPVEGLGVPQVNTIPDMKSHGVTGSGMWDCGITEEEEEQTFQVEVSVGTPCSASSRKDPTESLDAEEQWGTERTGLEFKGEEESTVTSKESASLGHVNWKSSSPQRCQEDPSHPTSQPPSGDTNVLSTVELMQERVRPKTYTWSGDRVPMASGNPRPRSRLVPCEGCPAWTVPEEASSNSTTIYKPHSDAGPPRPSWKGSPAGLPKVSELKKRFEA
ncbi:DENN domain-containing protein 1C isoform X2 [Ambystoma mexicanum]|uniref:DENN domain-containing protein 1C isoform X2 n=1 Tax=Ambystoma mexicanum TaxID=8296 RepID=UPI0037E75477